MTRNSFIGPTLEKRHPIPFSTSCFHETYRSKFLFLYFTLPDLLWLGLLPGLSEELLFRGVMLPALGFNHLAVIVSSICFGVLHLSGSGQWAYVFWATIVGVILGYSAFFSGNLLVPIVAHIVTNLVSSYLWKMQQSS